MANALREENRVRTLLGVDSSGVIRNVTIDGVSGYLNMATGTSGSGPASQLFANAKRDENRVTTALAEKADGSLQGALVDDDGYLYVNTS